MAFSEPVDLAVVGAGIVGAMTAYLAMLRRPDWRVLLLDRSFAGHGATLYSLGLDFPYGRTEFQKHLSIRSAAIYRELENLLPAPPLRQTTFVGVVDERRAAETIGRFTSTTVHRASARERAQVLSAHPGLSIRAGQELVVGCDAGYGVPGEVVGQLVLALRASGRSGCWEAAQVEDISAFPDGYRLQLFDERTIMARRVVMAPGPWVLASPCSALALAAGVRIKKVTALHIHAVPPPEAGVVYFFDEDAFLLPVLHRRSWLMSVTSLDWDCSPGLHLTIHGQERARALQILDAYWPALRKDCAGGRVFCDAYSRDWAPLVTASPEGGNFVFAGACSGAGFRLAPAIAEQALELLSICQNESTSQLTMSRLETGASC